jgi:hypothetical protein
VGYAPVYIATLLTCTLTLWLIIGVIWVLRQRQPSRQRVAFDFRYGLALSGLSLGRDERRKDVAVQVGLVLHNASDWPIKYHVEDMEVVIGDRAISKPNFTNMGGFISKGCNTMFLYPAFHKVWSTRPLRGGSLIRSPMGTRTLGS